MLCVKCGDASMICIYLYGNFYWSIWHRHRSISKFWIRLFGYHRLCFVYTITPYICSDKLAYIRHVSIMKTNQNRIINNTVENVGYDKKWKLCTLKRKKKRNSYLHLCQSGRFSFGCHCFLCLFFTCTIYYICRQYFFYVEK